MPIDENTFLSLKEAKKIGSKKYFNGKLCPKGHLSLKWTYNSSCCECSSIRALEHQKTRKDLVHLRYKRHRNKDIDSFREKSRDAAKKFRKNNPEKSKEISKKSYNTNKQKNQEASRTYRSRNSDSIKEKEKERNQKESRKLFRYASNSFRRASKLKATPPWVTKSHKTEISLLYKEAKRLTIETGIKYHVDHIEPLRGKNSCGLHILWNLQILTEEENLRKSNKLNLAI